jgi:two-component system chemotaxis sensor kinase CheA
LGQAAKLLDSEPSMASDPSLVADFIVEAREHLVSTEEQALALEKEPEDMEAINALFRAFHSIKGLAAFLEFDQIQQFSHEVETLLDCARQGELQITSDVIDLILAAGEHLGRCVDAVEKNSPAAGGAEVDALVKNIRAAAAGAAKPAEAKRAEVAASVEPAPVEAVPEAAKADAVEVEEASPFEEAVPAAPDHDPLRQEALKTVALPATGQKTNERFSIRVDASRLDHLMDMVGELVIAESLARTGLAAVASTSSTLSRSVAQMAQITSEVQRTTISMRMVPIGQLMRRTGKIVRDVSRKCGKPVEVEYEGEETEVDKTIAEELADPLMHIVRNAIDHGIETPEERAMCGKSPVAKIRVAASHEGSQIVVSISDDGRGLNRAKILKKAQEQNLITSTDLSDAAVSDLIFHPGFSTADKITTVSGRGVGMDVVRRHVERLRGRVDVKSVSGGGTTFTIRLPLTRAIIDGLVVRVADSRYVIPMSYVREIFRPTESSVSTVHGKGKLVMLHDRLLPIVHLSRAFGLGTPLTNPWEAVLVVAESGGRQICLLADEMLGKQEVVVKSLGKYLALTPGVCGGTILGDGKVGLILDMQNFEVQAS